LLSSRYFWTTIGSNALVFLGAFEALAVTTVMPTISRELDGQALYSVAFSGALAASVIAMVASGWWSDRSGPRGPLVAAIVVFLVGLLVSGFAVNMELFIVGRLLQGAGMGGINVALYVIIARIYPPALHPRVFGLFAAMWVLPSFIGPPVAGFIADEISWEWVFLGVAALVLFAGAAVVPAIRAIREDEPTDGAEEGAPERARPGHPLALPLAVVVAVAVLAISVGGESGGPLAPAIAVASFVVVVLAVRPLLPRGTLLARRGLPATVLIRGAVAATFFAAEIYLPYLLTEEYDLPSWLAGLILTVGALAWALASAIQSRIGERMSHGAVIRVGAVLLFFGVGVQLLTATVLLSPFVAAAGWFFAAGGMGLVYPRISTNVLAHSDESNQGFNSSAMSISDAVGGATAIALSGLLFSAALSLGGRAPFIVAFALTTVLALWAIFVSLRVQEPEPTE
jgi:MFS family permease